MMRFRAVLNDIGRLNTERPVQILSNNRADIDAWASKTLQQAVAADAWVDVYQTIEERIAVIRKPAEPKP